MPRIIHYTKAALDRADALRSDPDWIAGQLADEKTMLLPVCNDRNLLRANGEPALRALKALKPKPCSHTPMKWCCWAGAMTQASSRRT